LTSVFTWAASSAFCCRRDGLAVSMVKPIETSKVEFGQSSTLVLRGNGMQEDSGWSSEDQSSQRRCRWVSGTACPNEAESKKEPRPEVVKPAGP
jgi:hypothetical protein